jgi:hypothetical protein
MVDEDRLICNEHKIEPAGEPRAVVRAETFVGFRKHPVARAQCPAVTGQCKRNNAHRVKLFMAPKVTKLALDKR